MKYEFCETCPDKGAEICPLPSTVEQGVSVAKRAGWKALQYMDVALTGDIEHPGVTAHEGRWPHKQSLAAAQAKIDLDLRISDCVAGHLAGPEQTTSLHIVQPEA